MMVRYGFNVDRAYWDGCVEVQMKASGRLAQSMKSLLTANVDEASGSRDTK